MQARRDTGALVVLVLDGCAQNEQSKRVREVQGDLIRVREAVIVTTTVRSSR